MTRLLKRHFFLSIVIETVNFECFGEMDLTEGGGFEDIIVFND
jgi:hypothetical protein